MLLELPLLGTSLSSLVREVRIICKGPRNKRIHTTICGADTTLKKPKTNLLFCNYTVDLIMKGSTLGNLVPEMNYTEFSCLRSNKLDNKITSVTTIN